MNGKSIPQLVSFLNTLYLFTANDITFMLAPMSICGALLPLAPGLHQYAVPPLHVIIIRYPLVLIWVWTNLLQFNLSNQSQPGAVLEDQINKPWRPIPAGRVTVAGAHRLLRTLRLVTVGMSVVMGGTASCIALTLLTWWYNDLGGGDHWLLRNFINAGGYLSFLTGAMRVARGPQDGQIYSSEGLQWLGIIVMIVVSTMHTQDLYDQEGDSLRGRTTIPLVFGDMNARYSIAIPTLIWSYVAPAFWRISVLGSVPLVVLGEIVVTRLLDRERRTIGDDKRTVKVWNAWILVIFSLPVQAHVLRTLNFDAMRILYRIIF